MSGGQTPRTPANFPRMKHRAAGRLMRKRGHGKTTPSDAWAAMKAVGKAFSDALDALGHAFTGFAAAFRPVPTRADFALVPAPRLMPMPTAAELRADLTALKTGRFEP